MTVRFLCSVLLLLAVASMGSWAPKKATPRVTVNWTSFRGPDASGVAEGAAAPATWNVEDGKNVRWKVAIPGMGHSSPVIWGNRLFITSAVRSGGEGVLKPGLYGDIAPVEDTSEHRWQLYCLDK